MSPINYFSLIIMLSLEQTQEDHVDFQFFSLILKWLRTNQDFCHSNFIGSVKNIPHSLLK